MEKHSEIVGGSTAERVYGCSGSVVLNAQVKKEHLNRIAVSTYGEGVSYVSLDSEKRERVKAAYEKETSSPYAKQGTVLHEAIADLVSDKEVLESVVGNTYHGVRITQSMVDEFLAPAYEDFQSYCKKIKDEQNQKLSLCVENSLPFPGIKGAHGTVDIIGSCGTHVFIWDWKFGEGVVVDAKDNKQLMVYAVAGLTDLYGEDFLSTMDVLGFTVDLVIHQPKRGGMKVWSTSVNELAVFYDSLKDQTKKIFDEEYKLGSHCTWCAAKRICPAFSDLVTSAIDFSKDVADFSDSLAEKYAEVDLLKKYIKHIEGTVYAELKNGRSVTGYELDRKKGNTSWQDTDAAVATLKDMGFGVDEIFDTKLKSPTRMKTYLKTFSNGKDMVKRLEEYTYRPYTGFKVVPEDQVKNPLGAGLDQLADTWGKKDSMEK